MIHNLCDSVSTISERTFNKDVISRNETTQLRERERVLQIASAFWFKNDNFTRLSSTSVRRAIIEEIAFSHLRFSATVSMAELSQNCEDISSVKILHSPSFAARVQQIVHRVNFTFFKGR